MSRASHVVLATGHFHQYVLKSAGGHRGVKFSPIRVIAPRNRLGEGLRRAATRRDPRDHDDVVFEVSVVKRNGEPLLRGRGCQHEMCLRSHPWANSIRASSDGRIEHRVVTDVTQPLVRVGNSWARTREVRSSTPSMKSVLRAQ